MGGYYYQARGREVNQAYECVCVPSVSPAKMNIKHNGTTYKVKLLITNVDFSNLFFFPRSCQPNEKCIFFLHLFIQFFCVISFFFFSINLTRGKEENWCCTANIGYTHTYKLFWVSCLFMGSLFST